MNIFRRSIELRCRQTPQGWEARAALEDDFHHFRVMVRCAAEQVQSVAGETIRHPYSLCPGAAGQLAQLAGMKLDCVAHSVTRVADATQQCTHMLELAGLAIALVARRDERRSYRIAVPRRVQENTVATLARNSVPMLTWHVAQDYITAPAPYAGVPLRAGMARWALQALEPENAEAALVLRRAVVISRGREIDQDARAHAEANSTCFVQQPARAPLARRMVGSTWDFTSTPDALCALDARWLAWQS